MTPKTGPVVLNFNLGVPPREHSYLKERTGKKCHLVFLNVFDKNLSSAFPIFQRNRVDHGVGGKKPCLSSYLFKKVISEKWV